LGGKQGESCTKLGDFFKKKSKAFSLKNFPTHIAFSLFRISPPSLAPQPTQYEYLFKYFFCRFGNQIFFLNTTMRSFLLFILLCTSLLPPLSAQTKVYKGSSTYSGDILCTLSQGKVYKNTSTYSGDILLTIRDGKIYSGTSTYSGDVLYTIREGKVYAGNSSYSGDIRWSLTDGKVYEGTSSYSGDVLATRKEGKIYKGNSTYSGDILFTMDQLVRLEEFVAIWHVFNYVY
jgi:hypothetical protein